MIAPPIPPLAAPTMTDSAVAMKSALPRPQPARKPAICATVPDAPASALNTITSASPPSSARLAPTRDATNPVPSIATPVIAKYVVKSIVTWLGDASRSCARTGRIGSTSPIPMKAMTAANATAHTAFGWRSRPVLTRSPRRGARGSAPRRRASRAPRGRARRSARRGSRHGVRRRSSSSVCPAGVIETRTARPSAGSWPRVTSPCPSSRPTRVVADGWAIDS